MFERSRKGETALLIQPHAGGPPDDGSLEEFADLARSAGATVAATLNARIDKPNPATLIGRGKLEDGKAACAATGAVLVRGHRPRSPGPALHSMSPPASRGPVVLMHDSPSAVMAPA